MRSLIVLLFLGVLLEVHVKAECECNCNCGPQVSVTEECCEKKTPKKKPTKPEDICDRFNRSFQHVIDQDNPAWNTLAADTLCLARSFAQIVEFNPQPDLLQIKLEFVNANEWEWIRVPLQTPAMIYFGGNEVNLDMATCALPTDLVARARELLPRVKRVLETALPIYEMFLRRYGDCLERRLQKMRMVVDQFQKYDRLQSRIYKIVPESSQ